MQNIREIISENLVCLRKKYGYTQMELAKKVNYSDKAVSRWENGEVMPDYEVLETLGEVYGVDITFFFKKHEKDFAGEKELQVEQTNKIAVAGLVLTSIWMFATIIFVFLKMYIGVDYWLAFIFAIPVSFGVLNHYNKIFFHIRFGGIVCKSAMVWSTILAVYLFLVLPFSPEIIRTTGNYYWLLFIVGIPVQIAVILGSIIRKTF